ncbi:MAG: HRDC domain-containing protein [Alistipes sp.]|nr:HRDC domain-containing protein [Alistipes sp.]
MQIKIFDIISGASSDDLEVINKFIRGNKVLDIDKQFYTSSDNVGHWSIFITYIQSTQSQQPEQREKIDYKNVLSAEDFEKFTRLRALRKQLANDDAVPAYAVFTDYELAQLAQMPSLEVALIQKVSGIGAKRIEKYGKLICERYKESYQ